MDHEARISDNAANKFRVFEFWYIVGLVRKRFYYFLPDFLYNKED